MQSNQIENQNSTIDNSKPIKCIKPAFPFSQKIKLIPEIPRECPHTKLILPSTPTLPIIRPPLPTPTHTNLKNPNKPLPTPPIPQHPKLATPFPLPPLHTHSSLLPKTPSHIFPFITTNHHTSSTLSGTSSNTQTLSSNTPRARPCNLLQNQYKIFYFFT